MGLFCYTCELPTRGGSLFVASRERPNVQRRRMRHFDRQDARRRGTSIRYNNRSRSSAHTGLDRSIHRQN